MDNNINIRQERKHLYYSGSPSGLAFVLFRLFFALTVLAFILACKPKHPAHIKTGEHSCARCLMQITDMRFNTQAVTSKGKIKHYDSIECMVVHTSTEHDKKASYKNFYVKNFFNSKEFIPAQKAHYLHSSKLASPMKAGLSAYPTQKAFKKAQQRYTGKTIQFADLRHLIKNVSHKK